MIHNLRNSMTFEEFYHEAYAVLGPEPFQMYLVYQDTSRDRIKITVDNFITAFAELLEVASGRSLKPWGTLFVFYYNSSHLQLTAQNLKLYHSGGGGCYDADNLNDSTADETESVHSIDSNLQREMNAEVTTRDCNCCVICKRSADEVEIQAAHIFELQERKWLSVQDWMALKGKYKIDSLYGPKNGLTMYVFLVSQQDVRPHSRSLSIECVPQYESFVSYKID